MESSNIFDFTEFFTSDGSELMNNYITSLKNYMIKEGVSSQQINVIINGIYEFIQEFASSYKDDKINFSSTLNLIDEIGSPTEIIQSLDYKKDENSFSCPYCKMVNSPESSYCEFCGKKLQFVNDNTNSMRFSHNRNYGYIKLFSKQDIIDKPYSRFLVIFWTILTTFGIILSFTSNIWSLYQPSNIVVFFFGSAVVSISWAFPWAVILAIFLGFVLDFVLKDVKSIRFQYDKIINHYEENVLGGFFIVIFGAIMLFFFLALSQTKNLDNFLYIFSMWFIIVLIDSVSLIYYFRRSLRPRSLNLTQLNLFKLRIDKINKKTYFKYNKEVLLPILLLSALTFVLAVGIMTFYQFIFGTLLFSIVYLMIFNGFITMKINSWKTISEYPIK